MENSADWYLAALLKNGQIYGDYLYAWSNGSLVAYTHAARPDSLDRRHHSEWAKSDLDSVIEAFGQPPACEIIEDRVPKRFPSWKRSSSFYLFTTAFDDESPIRCGDTGSALPLYLLPVTPETREYIYFWAATYRDHDNIWLRSGALEIPAYKQLADPKSELSVTGRELCADVERATGKPTYYFLQRYWGRKDNEAEALRLCPLCGGKWHRMDNTIDYLPFHDFPFRCERCRLVSQYASSNEDERHARIGEFKRKKADR